MARVNRAERARDSGLNYFGGGSGEIEISGNRLLCELQTSRWDYALVELLTPRFGRFFFREDGVYIAVDARSGFQRDSPIKTFFGLINFLFRRAATVCARPPTLQLDIPLFFLLSGLVSEWFFFSF